MAALNPIATSRVNMILSQGMSQPLRKLAACSLNIYHLSPATVNGKTVPKYSGPTVDTFITAAGRDDLLAFMKKYWVSQGSTDASFWAHEYSKHGTCFSTFDTKCYPSFTKYEDLIDFFDTVTKAWLKVRDSDISFSPKHSSNARTSFPHTTGSRRPILSLPTRQPMISAQYRTHSRPKLELCPTSVARMGY
jgi:Ribonuclease T2 family